MQLAQAIQLEVRVIGVLEDGGVVRRGSANQCVGHGPVRKERPGDRLTGGSGAREAVRLCEPALPLCRAVLEAHAPATHAGEPVPTSQRLS